MSTTSQHSLRRGVDPQALRDVGPRQQQLMDTAAWEALEQEVRAQFRHTHRCYVTEPVSDWASVVQARELLLAFRGCFGPDSPPTLVAWVMLVERIIMWRAGDAVKGRGWSWERLREVQLRADRQNERTKARTALSDRGLNRMGMRR